MQQKAIFLPFAHRNLPFTHRIGSLHNGLCSRPSLNGKH